MILYINCCIRPNSRTHQLAKFYLSKRKDTIKELILENEALKPLNYDTLTKRDHFITEHDFTDEMFQWAHLFKDADEIVISAPYYDLGFPASLKLLIENITVNDLTFSHDEAGMRIGLCNAKRLVYITTSGSSIIVDHGYQYIKDLCDYMYGIKECVCFSVENLDKMPERVNELIQSTQGKIIDYLEKQS